MQVLSNLFGYTFRHIQEVCGFIQTYFNDAFEPVQRCFQTCPGSFRIHSGSLSTYLGDAFGSIQDAFARTIILSYSMLLYCIRSLSREVLSDLFAGAFEPIWICFRTYLESLLTYPRRCFWTHPGRFRTHPGDDFGPVREISDLSTSVVLQ